MTANLTERRPKLSLTSRAPARPADVTMVTATATAVAALGTLVALGYASGHLLLIPPMAASMALVAGAPVLPLAQPRNVIGGQVLSALVGVGVGLVSHTLWAGAVAGGLALGVMLLARMSHSPAAATAVIGASVTAGQFAFVVAVAAAAIVLVGFGVARSTFSNTPYPQYWW